MNFYRELVKITVEIWMAIFIIIFGYAIWDNFNVNDYNMAKLNDKTREVLISDNNNILFLHNVGKVDNDFKLFLKINKNNYSNNIDFIYDNKSINLDDFLIDEDSKYYYFNVDDIKFIPYETKEFSYKLLSNDVIDYEFVNTI